MNAILFRFPTLYGTRLVGYESHLQAEGQRDLVTQLDQVLGVTGDIIECGSAHCGTSIVMAQYAISRGSHKLVYACDSYEGFDPAELARERAAGLTSAQPAAFTSTSYRYVQRKLAALRLDGSVRPIKGFFQDTLPNLPGPFCLALIDCDLRDSLVYAAQTLWPRLSPGGRILFDDYNNPGFRGAKAGVDLFVANHQFQIAEHGLLRRLYYILKAQ